MLAGLDTTLSLVLTAPRRRPATHLPRRLNGLFRELRLEAPKRPADDIEDLIWALWIGHEDLAAAAAMHAAMEAMRAREMDLARPILDRLVDDHPDWPEAWNKRATVNAKLERFSESSNDIARTIQLEPRHFGALAGFAQICVKTRHYREARAAFQIALAVNPHLSGVAEALLDLSDAGESLN